MLEAVMGGPGEDQVRSSQLLDVAEPLELRRVYELDQQGVQLNVAMDGVVEHLGNTPHLWKGLAPAFE